MTDAFWYNAVSTARDGSAGDILALRAGMDSHTWTVVDAMARQRPTEVRPHLVGPLSRDWMSSYILRYWPSGWLTGISAADMGRLVEVAEHDSLQFSATSDNDTDREWQAAVSGAVSPYHSNGKIPSLETMTEIAVLSAKKQRYADQAAKPAPPRRGRPPRTAI